MSYTLLVEQLLNGVQFGVMLFLMSAGLTLVFGIMNLINLAHGSLYMAGAFIAASLISATGSFILSVLIAVAVTGALGMVMEIVILRPFYARTHLDQVVVTFGLILVFNAITRLIWGPVPVPMPLPAYLAGSVELFAGVRYPIFRLAILVVGAAVAVGLYVVVVHTRAGMWVRAGAANRPMASALGVDVQFVFLMVFAVGAALAGLAGIMAGPIFAVQVGIGGTNSYPCFRRCRNRWHRIDPRRVSRRPSYWHRRYIRARAAATGTRQHGDFHCNGGHPGMAATWPIPVAELIRAPVQSHHWYSRPQLRRP